MVVSYLILLLVIVGLLNKRKFLIVDFVSPYMILDGSMFILMIWNDIMNFLQKNFSLFAQFFIYIFFFFFFSLLVLPAKVK